MSRPPFQVLYAKYNSTRRPEFRLTTEICENAEGRFVRKRAGEEAARAHLEELCRNHESLRDYYDRVQVIPAVPDGASVVFPYIQGQTLADAIDARRFDREAFVAWVNEKLEAVLSVKEACQVPFERTEGFEELFGPAEIGDVPALNPANIDSLLTNFVEDGAGIHCIDCEWVCRFPVPVAFIKYRALLYLYVTQVHAQLDGVSQDEMLGWFGFSEDELKTYWQMDDHFQQYVHGEGRKHIYITHYRKMDQNVVSLSQEVQRLRVDVANQAGVIQNQDVQIRNQDVQIRNQDVQIRNQNMRISSQDVQIQQLAAAYQTVTNAFFWRVTKPARAMLDAIKRWAQKHEGLYHVLVAGKSALKHGPVYALKSLKRHIAGKQSIRRLDTRLSDADRAHQQETVFPKDITFSILVPLYNTPESFLREMMQSVQDQTYAKWELCLADGSDDAHASVGKICRALAAKDQRIRYRKLEKNLGISGNTNACIDMATGNYIALFDHDDILHPAALYEAMKAICEEGADYVYTDEATFKSPNLNDIITVHYKPDFAPDNLLANNYICHFSVFSAQLLKQVEGFRSAYDGSQDHDMILRLTHAARKVVHIPKVLYWWRSHPQSVAKDINAKQYAVDAAKRAVHDFLRDYQGVEAEIESTRAFPTIFRIRYPIADRAKVSIVIPNKDHVDDLRRCVDSILGKTSYPNYEIVIVENNSETDEIFAYYAQLERDDRIRVLRYKGGFNYSRINNWAVRQCYGEYIVLLNNDTEVITPDWLENLMMYAQREDVGAVGAKLYFPDGRIQHAGIILKLGADRVAGHGHYGADYNNLGYMGRLCYAQDVSAVTAACLMIRHARYDEIGGFNENLAVAFNDVDFCLKLREKGYLNIFTPFAELYHHESISRGKDTGENKQGFEAECTAFRERWGSDLEKGDPYYNPNFSLDSSMFEPL